MDVLIRIRNWLWPPDPAQPPVTVRRVRADVWDFYAYMGVQDNDDAD